MTFDPQAPLSTASVPLLKDYLQSAAKLATAWRCGLELELFGYAADSLTRLDAAQVQKVLTELAWPPTSLVFEGTTLVESRIEGEACITVEPGGQIEFSGRPHSSLADTERDLLTYLARLHEIAAEHKLLFLGVGFDPLRGAEEQHFFPKRRYEVMRPFLAARGGRAWDMMHRTCAIQVNIDYGSSEDLAKKFILGNRLAPIFTAIFANSPFEAGQLSGYKSTRAAVWLETDADRTGAPRITFDPEKFSLGVFVDYALDVPMIFVRRGNRYQALPLSFTFRQFLENGFCDCAMINIQPVWQDWVDHLSTIFTDARLKQYVELRSVDASSLKMTLAAQALYKGLMYDRGALDEAWRLLPAITPAGHRELQEWVAREGLAAHTDRVDVLHVAKEVVQLATSGLKRIAPEDVRYLDVLHERVVEDEVCPADILIRNWHGSWHASMTKVIEHLRLA